MMTKMTFEYENNEYGLVPFTESMVQSSNYRNWFHDRQVTKYNSHGLFPYTDAQMKRFFAGLNDGSKIIFAIYKKNGCGDGAGNIIPPEHIGNVGLQSINLINRSAEFAIIIGANGQRGKGLGTQVTAVTLYHAFVKLGLNRVWSGTADDNEGMNRIFLKLGFQKEGHFREGMWRHGLFHDIHCYGILKKEFTKSDTQIMNFLVEKGWKLWE